MQDKDYDSIEISVSETNRLKVQLIALDKESRDEYGYLYLHGFVDIHGSCHWFQPILVSTKHDAKGNYCYQYLPVKYLDHDLTKVKVQLPEPALNTRAKTAWVQWEDFGQ